MTVVGVVDNVRQKSGGGSRLSGGLRRLSPASVSDGRWIDLKSRQDEWAIGFLSFAIRTSDDPALSVPTVRQVVSAVDPNIGIDTMMPMSRLVASSLARQRFYAVSARRVCRCRRTAGRDWRSTACSRTPSSNGLTRLAFAWRLVLSGEQVIGLVLTRGAILTALGIGVGLVGCGRRSALAAESAVRDPGARSADVCSGRSLIRAGRAACVVSAGTSRDRRGSHRRAESRVMETEGSRQ